MRDVPSARGSLNRHIWAGLAVLVLLFGAVGGWSATAELSGAVIAEGRLAVESHVKDVQHAEGGMIRALKVAEGDHVRAGDILLKLDDTVPRANLAIIASELDRLSARKARLEAEQTGAERLAFPADLLARKNETEVSRLLARETALFDSRRAARSGRIAQLRERIAQLKREIESIGHRKTANRREMEALRKELSAIRDLWNRGLTTLSRLTAIERDIARLEGERGQLAAATARAKDRIAEVELTMLQIDHDLRSEAAAELRDVEARQAELFERRRAVEAQLANTAIRAPQAGVVHALSVHTIGGVVGAGETIMQIVPHKDALVVEARVSAEGIDQVHLGQEAVLRFSAFNRRTTPQIKARVVHVGADLVQDARTGAAYYAVRLVIPPEEHARLQALKPVSGIPLEVFIRTDRRTAISYFLKPFQDQMARAFRER